MNIHIRDFDGDTYNILVRRAEERGLSLSEYLRQELAMVAKRPTNADVFMRLRKLPSLKLSVSAVEMVREDRDAR